MSKEEVRKVIMIIVSGYLAYIGYKLLRDYDPSKNKIYLVAAIVFIAFGIVSAVHYVRNVIALRRMAGQSDEETEPDVPEAEPDCNEDDSNE